MIKVAPKRKKMLLADSMWAEVTPQWTHVDTWNVLGQPGPAAAAYGNATAVAADGKAIAFAADGNVTDGDGTLQGEGGCATDLMAKAQPIAPVQGDLPSSRPAHGRFNEELEVGNFGLFLGNWGTQASAGNAAETNRRRMNHDRQILRCPGQVIVLLEASPFVEELMKRPPVAGHPDAQTHRLSNRSTYEHYVVRGDEEEGAVLIAARMDNTTRMEMLGDYEIYNDKDYTDSGKQKQALSRSMVCRIYFKQNVGHIGRSVVVCGVHGNYNTMKWRWDIPLTLFWDRLAERIKKYGVNFVAGDFNMSLTEVRKQLHNRGLVVDCAAWYPWMHETDGHTQPLGWDSCGIFYIGGSVQVSMPWELKDIGILTAVADEIEQDCADNDQHLDTYGGQNWPGQPWKCYRTKKKEDDHQKSLEARLVDLLTPSTTVEQLAAIPKRDGTSYCPYLRLKQKMLDKDEWLVDGVVHNGAHFPLCMWTNGARARSEEASKRRASNRWYLKGYGKGGNYKGGQYAAAVADNAAQPRHGGGAYYGKGGIAAAVADMHGSGGKGGKGKPP